MTIALFQSYSYQFCDSVLQILVHMHGSVMLKINAWRQLFGVHILHLDFVLRGHENTYCK